MVAKKLGKNYEKKLFKIQKKKLEVKTSEVDDLWTERIKIDIFHKHFFRIHFFLSIFRTAECQKRIFFFKFKTSTEYVPFSVRCSLIPVNQIAWVIFWAIFCYHKCCLQTKIIFLLLEWVSKSCTQKKRPTKMSKFTVTVIRIDCNSFRFSYLK